MGSESGCSRPACMCYAANSQRAVRAKGGRAHAPEAVLISGLLAFLLRPGHVEHNLVLGALHD
jgi:hypothetical protein